MSTLPNSLDKHYTPDQFFEFLATTEGKFEYNSGTITERGLSDYNHSAIKVDTQVALGELLGRSDWEVFDGDLMVHVPSHDAYLSPDLYYIKGEPIFADKEHRRVTNPGMLVEVLSEDTELYDRAEKWHMYRSLPSFREYTMIDSQKYSVESWYKLDEEHWYLEECSDPAGSIHLRSLGVDLLMTEIYRRVDF